VKQRRGKLETHFAGDNRYASAAFKLEGCGRLFAGSSLRSRSILLLSGVPGRDQLVGTVAYHRVGAGEGRTFVSDQFLLSDADGDLVATPDLSARTTEVSNERHYGSIV
jgi:hypothetical protein